VHELLIVGLAWAKKNPGGLSTTGIYPLREEKRIKLSGFSSWPAGARSEPEFQSNSSVFLADS
jgi:hypothetical protein